jgi:hypothetical protein
MMSTYGCSLNDFHNFKITFEGRKTYNLNLDKTLQWLMRLRSYASYQSSIDFRLLMNRRDGDFAMIGWCHTMLQPQPEDRIIASV